MYDVSVCSVVLHVHVKQYDMCMWSSTTCASHAALHVHVKQRCAPGKQGRRIKMRCPVKVLTGIFHPILLSAF